MSAVRSIRAIARADFLERTRRYSFFLALLFAVFLGYATATGKIFIQFDEYRGLYTSGWIATLVALTITCFVSLVGFYVVKNSVERDCVTGVGQILAGTPLSKAAYAFGKFISNFAVLSTMVGVLAVTSEPQGPEDVCPRMSKRIVIGNVGVGVPTIFTLLCEAKSTVRYSWLVSRTPS